VKYPMTQQINEQDGYKEIKPNLKDQGKVNGVTPCTSCPKGIGHARNSIFENILAGKQ
jgi:hypothetical protein